MNNTQDNQDNNGYVYRLSATARLHNLMQNVKYSFRWHKPVLTLHLMKKTIEGIILRKSVPRQIEIALDYACNLNCSHCSSKILMKSHKEILQPEHYKRLYEELKGMGIVSYIFTGGEPLVFADRLLEIIRIFEPEKNLITIQSNATLLTSEMAGRLKNAKVDTIIASLDSFHVDDDENAIQLENADKTIRLVREYGMNILFVTVLTHSNLRSDVLNQLIQFAKERNIILFFNVAVPVGSWAGNKDIILTPDDQIYLRELTKKHPHTRFDFATNFSGFGCPAFKERLYITPYGDILGCPFLQISFGNIKMGDTITLARRQAMQSAYFDHYHKLCLAAEDREFMGFYLPMYNRMSGELPIPYEKISKEIEENKALLREPSDIID